MLITLPSRIRVGHSTAVFLCVGVILSSSFALTKRSCRTYTSNTTCLAACPPQTFVDQTSQPGKSLCQACDAQCVQCTGAGPGQCTACRAVLYSGVCLATCPLGTYRTTAATCDLCHPLCAMDCIGPGADQCVGNASNPTGCLNFRNGRTCVATCDAGQYGDPVGHVCGACNALCNGCSGPAEANCIACVAGRYRDTRLLQCPACSNQCVGAACGGPGPGNCSAGCVVSLLHLLRHQRRYLSPHLHLLLPI